MLATLKLVPSPLTSYLSYHALPLLITTYHILSLRLEAKLFSFGNCKISSQSPNYLSHLITPCHSLSHIITSYPPAWKQNFFHLATVKIVASPLTSYHILSRLVTSYRTLSQLIPQVGSKTIFILQLLNQFPGSNLLITSYHALSLLITPYHMLSPPRLEEKPF